MPIRKLTTRPQPDWSKTLDGYFIGFCRKVFRWSPAYRSALKAAFVEKRDGIEYYRCKSCGTVVERPQKQVDHIDPVVPVASGWNRSWDGYRDRLFVHESKLQVLCKSCHKGKTGTENQGRKIWRSKPKKRSASRPA